MNIIETEDPNVIGEAVFDGFRVRITGKPDEPWFVLADVCNALGLSNPRDAARRLCADEKGVDSIHSLGGIQQMTVVSESGLYAVILRCRDAMTEGTAAYRFRRWVTNEVLPSIRKTGKYEAQSQPAEPKPAIPTHEILDLFPGDKFGKLTIVSEAAMQSHHRMVVARCECGTEFSTRATHIRTGRVTTCPVCGRQKKRLTAPKDNSFLLSTYQLAMAEAQNSPKARSVMDWCHSQMLEGAGSD